MNNIKTIHVKKNERLKNKLKVQSKRNNNINNNIYNKTMSNINDYFSKNIRNKNGNNNIYIIINNKINNKIKTDIINKKGNKYIRPNFLNFFKNEEKNKTQNSISISHETNEDKKINNKFLKKNNTSQINISRKKFFPETNINAPKKINSYRSISNKKN